MFGTLRLNETAGFEAWWRPHHHHQQCRDLHLINLWWICMWRWGCLQWFECKSHFASFDTGRPTKGLWIMAPEHLHGLRWSQSLGGEAWRQRNAMCFGSSLRTSLTDYQLFTSHSLSHWNMPDGWSKAAWIDGKAVDTPASLAFLEHTASHNLEHLMPSQKECFGLHWDQRCCFQVFKKYDDDDDDDDDDVSGLKGSSFAPPRREGKGRGHGGGKNSGLDYETMKGEPWLNGCFCWMLQLSFWFSVSLN